MYSLPTSLVNEHRLKEVTHVVKIRNMLLELLCVLVQSCDMDNDFRYADLLNFLIVCFVVRDNLKIRTIETIHDLVMLKIVNRILFIL